MPRRFCKSTENLNQKESLSDLVPTGGNRVQLEVDFPVIEFDTQMFPTTRILHLYVISLTWIKSITRNFGILVCLVPETVRRGVFKCIVS